MYELSAKNDRLSLHLVWGQTYLLLTPQTIPLAFLLQMNQREVSVVAADTKLLPAIDPIQLLPQGFV